MMTGLQLRKVVRDVAQRLVSLWCGFFSFKVHAEKREKKRFRRCSWRCKFGLTELQAWTPSEVLLPDPVAVSHLHVDFSSRHILCRWRIQSRRDSSDHDPLARRIALPFRRFFRVPLDSI